MAEDSELVGGISVSIGANDSRLSGDLARAEQLVQAWIKEVSARAQINVGARFAGGTGAPAGGGGGDLGALTKAIEQGFANATFKAAPRQAAQAPSRPVVGPAAQTAALANRGMTSFQQALAEQAGKVLEAGEVYDPLTNEIVAATAATQQFAAGAKRAGSIEIEVPEFETPPVPTVDTGALQSEIKAVVATLAELRTALTAVAETAATSARSVAAAPAAAPARGRPRRGAQARAATQAPTTEGDEEEEAQGRLGIQTRMAAFGLAEGQRQDARVQQTRRAGSQRAFAEQERQRIAEVAATRRQYSTLTQLAERYFDDEIERVGTAEDQKRLISLSAEAEAANNEPPRRPTPTPVGRTPENETPAERAMREKNARDQRVADEANAPRVRRLTGLGAVRAAQQRQEEIFARSRGAIAEDPETREARIQEQIERARAERTAAQSTGRTGASRIGSLLGGTGGRLIEVEARQAAARRELNAANRAALPFERELVILNDEIATASPRTAAGLRKVRDEFQRDPATVNVFKRQSDAIKELGKTTQDFQKLQSGANIARNLAAVAAGSFAFSAALKAVDVVVSAVTPAIGSFIDEQVGFTATSTRVTTALAQQTLALHGNVDAALAATEAQAGLSKGAADTLNAQLRLTTQVKAGALAQQQASDLFRAARGAQGAPEGLYGGYGGIGGTGLLAGQLGGGKGFTEQLLGDISAFRKPAGQGPDLLGNLTQGLSYLTSPDIRNVVNEQAQNQGNPVFDVIGAAGRLNPVTGPPQFALDVLGGIGDQLFRGGKPGTPPPGTPGAGGTGIEPPTPELIAYLKELKSATERGASALGQTVTATYDMAKSQDEINRAMAAAAQEGDQFGVAMARLGVILRDTSGDVADAAERRAANQQAAVGRGRIDPATLAAQFNVADQALVRMLDTTQKFALAVQQPAQAALQNLAQPLLPPGTGIPGGAQAPGQQKAIDLQQELNGYYQQGQDILLNTYKPEIVRNFGVAAGQAFQQQINGITALGSQIADLQADIANTSAEQATKQYNYQLFIARRTLQDINGLTGRNRGGVGQSYLGQLEKENLALSRQGQLLQFNLSQRQINFQTALAGFQTPGVTPEERQARVREAQVEASFAQKQLDISKQIFGNQVQIVDIQNLRQGADLAKQITLLISGRQAAIKIAVDQQELILAQKRSEQLVKQAGTYLSSIDTIAATGISHIQELEIAAGRALTRTETQAVKLVGQFMADLAKAYTRFFAGPVLSYADLGRAEQGTGPTSHAAGGALFSTSGQTNLTVGEAGTETVAVLRNPRAFFGEMGGGGTSVTFNGDIYVRSETDIDAIVRKVEKAMGRKASQIGLRSVG